MNWNRIKTAITMETNRRKVALAKRVGQDGVPVYQNIAGQTVTDRNIWAMLIEFQGKTGLNLLITEPFWLTKLQTGSMGDVFSCCGLVAFYRPKPGGALYSVKAGKGAIELCTCFHCEQFSLYLMRQKKEDCPIMKMMIMRARTQTK